MAVFLRIYALIFVWEITQPGECSLKQAIFHRNAKKYLANHVIETKQAQSERECVVYCVRDGSCASANYKTSGIGKGLCELNSKTLQDASDADKKTNPEYNHIYIIKETIPSGTPTKSQRNKTIHKPLHPSCKERLARNSSLSNGVYKLRNINSGEKYSVYCHMTEIFSCGSGGWTLVMKIDGQQNQFGYFSPYWTNKETYAVEDGLEGLTEKQTKLASYWNTPFNKICLGMKVNGVTKWITLNHAASSLHSVIAGGNYIHTTAGKDAWKSLLENSALQDNFYIEGFNIDKRYAFLLEQLYMTVRIGVVAGHNFCNPCDSCIGFGTAVYGCVLDVRSTSCGNMAVCAQFFNRNTAAFGFILVQ